jgi:carbonic anhydrase
LIDNWLRSIKDVYQRYSPSLENLPEEEKLARLCELNVIQQVSNTCHTNLVQRAWLRGQELTVHGWIYGIEDGILVDLGISCSAIEQLPDIYQLHKA